MSPESDVLVVGSGPVGLTLSVELLRRGVAVRTIERVTQRERESKGIWLMPRTLEILDSFGVADRLLARGHRLAANNIYTHGRRIASVGYGRIGQTRYPFALVIPQWEVEDALNDVISHHGGGVEPDTALTGIDQHADAAVATLATADGGTETAQVSWLVGCDGRTSATRGLLGVSFDGEPYATTLLMADAVLEGGISRDRSHTFQGPSGAFIAVPLPGGLTRAVVYAPPSEGHVEPTLEAIESLMDRYGPGGLSLHDPRWLSAFRIQRRIAGRLRVGRCLLAGDAAHVHSPFGGQGMNTGIQDATNLGWKLAATLGGAADARLLDSYESERQAVARRVLDDTHRQTKAFLGVQGPRAVVRDLVLRGLGTTGVLDRRIGTRLAGYADSYRDSALTHRHERGPAPRPGDRVPDVGVSQVLDPEASGPTGGRSLHGLLAPDGYTLVLVVDERRPGDGPYLDAIARSAPEEGVGVLTVVRGRSSAVDSCPGLVATRRIEDPAGALTSVLGADRGAALLVRPDGYLACRAQPHRAGHLLEHVATLRAAAPSDPLARAER